MLFFLSYEQLLSVSYSCRIYTLAVWHLNIVCEVVTSVTYNIEKLAELTLKLSTQCVTLTYIRLQSTFYLVLSQSRAIWNNNNIPLSNLIGTKKEPSIKINVTMFVNYFAVLRYQSTIQQRLNCIREFP